MEAKDTVILAASPGMSKEELLKAQAEISYKAGIREVVGWINKNIYMSAGDYLKWYPKWKAQLKDWEMEQ